MLLFSFSSSSSSSNIFFCLLHLPQPNCQSILFSFLVLDPHLSIPHAYLWFYSLFFPIHFFFFSFSEGVFIFLYLFICLFIYFLFLHTGHSCCELSTSTKCYLNRTNHNPSGIISYYSIISHSIFIELILIMWFLLPGLFCHFQFVHSSTCNVPLAGNS